MSVRQRVAAAILGLACSTPLGAQWLDYPTPGIPRTPDGKPNLAAPAPRTADGHVDLSGIWRTPTPDYLRDLATGGVEVRMHPWAEQLYKQRLANDGRDRPTAACLPHSVTDFDAHFTPKKILQLPGLVVMLFESYRSYRQIHTDGRPLPPEPRSPSWPGRSSTGVGTRARGWGSSCSCSGVLAGSPILPGQLRDFGFFVLAIRPDLFVDPGEFRASVSEYAAQIRGTRRLDCGGAGARALRALGGVCGRSGSHAASIDLEDVVYAAVLELGPIGLVTDVRPAARRGAPRPRPWPRAACRAASCDSGRVRAAPPGRALEPW